MSGIFQPHDYYRESVQRSQEQATAAARASANARAARKRTAVERTRRSARLDNTRLAALVGTVLAVLAIGANI